MFISPQGFRVWGIIVSLCLSQTEPVTGLTKENTCTIGKNNGNPFSTLDRPEIQISPGFRV